MTITVGRSALVVANLVVSRGADNTYAFRWSTDDGAGNVSPVDLSGFTAESQIRSVPGGDVWYVFSGISLDSLGNIVLRIPAVDSEVAAWDQFVTLGHWDVELTETATGLVTRFAEGSVTVSQDVTRDV